MSKKLSFMPLVMAALLILLPSLSLSGAVKGIDIWANNVVPTLFPFMAVSSILITGGALYGFAERCASVTKKCKIPYVASQAMVIGMLSGYPVGAGMTAMLYHQHELSSEQAEKAATLSSFCSPIFIIGTIGTRLMNNAVTGIIILASHYISFIITLRLFDRFWQVSEQFSLQNRNDARAKRQPFGALLKLSVENAVKTILTVGGYIVLFSIVIEFVFKSGILPENEYLRCTVSLLLEMSNGCTDICASSMSQSIKTAMLCFCTTWGGLCVQLQINGFLSECGASGRKTVLFKLIQALFSALCGYLCASFTEVSVSEVFTVGAYDSGNKLAVLFYGTALVVLCIAFAITIRNSSKKR